jgi:cytochrome c
VKKQYSILLASICLGLASMTALPSRAEELDVDKAAAAHELARRSGCLSCHDIKSKIVGPAYQAVALRHKDDPDRVELLVHKILHGSKGAWGNRAAMPANNVTPEVARELAIWVLSLAPKDQAHGDAHADAPKP